MQIKETDGAFGRGSKIPQLPLKVYIFMYIFFNQITIYHTARCRIIQSLYFFNYLIINNIIAFYVI